MLTYPWKCTVLHCNHLGNTWKPLVLMTWHFDYCLSASEGDNQSVRSSAPVVSRCFPGGYNVKLYISRGRLAWWLLAFLHSDGNLFTPLCLRLIHLSQIFIIHKIIGHLININRRIPLSSLVQSRNNTREKGISLSGLEQFLGCSFKFLLCLRTLLTWLRKHRNGDPLLTLTVLVATIDAQWEGMGDVGSARY